MSKQQYSIVGIQPPGHANVRLGGRFREVHLFELSQEQLAELHKDGCPHVILSEIPESKSKVTPTKPVTIEKKNQGYRKEK